MNNVILNHDTAFKHLFPDGSFILRAKVRSYRKGCFCVPAPIRLELARAGDKRDIAMEVVRSVMVASGYIGFAGFLRQIYEESRIVEEEDAFAIITGPLYFRKLVNALASDIIKSYYNNDNDSYATFLLNNLIDYIMMYIRNVRSNALIHLEDLDDIFWTAASEVVELAAEGRGGSLVLMRLYPLYRGIVRGLRTSNKDMLDRLSGEIESAVNDATVVADSIIKVARIGRDGEFAKAVIGMLGVEDLSVERVEVPEELELLIIV